MLATQCTAVLWLQVLALAAVRATPLLTQRCRDIMGTNLAIAEGFFARWQDVFEWHTPQVTHAWQPLPLGPGLAFADPCPDQFMSLLPNL